MAKPLFPPWTNRIPLIIGLGTPLALAGVVFAIWYWWSPWSTDVGYAPKQPVAYSHALHAGDLGIDCRYCHNTVETANYAAVPPAATCMNCHTQVRSSSPKLAMVKASFESGEPIEWVKIHQLPDYAYFSHQVHVAAGVGCESCHGRVDQMKVVQLDQPLSMGWCLNCHRNPEPSLRPKDKVTVMGYDPVAAGYEASADPHRTRTVEPPVHCSGCHR